MIKLLLHKNWKESETLAEESITMYTVARFKYGINKFKEVGKLIFN